MHGWQSFVNRHRPGRKCYCFNLTHMLSDYKNAWTPLHDIKSCLETVQILSFVTKLGPQNTFLFLFFLGVMSSRWWRLALATSVIKAPCQYKDGTVRF